MDDVDRSAILAEGDQYMAGTDFLVGEMVSVTRRMLSLDRQRVVVWGALTKVLLERMEDVEPSYVASVMASALMRLVDRE